MDCVWLIYIDWWCLVCFISSDCEWYAIYRLIAGEESLFDCGMQIYLTDLIYGSDDDMLYVLAYILGELHLCIIIVMCYILLRNYIIILFLTLLLWFNAL